MADLKSSKSYIARCGIECEKCKFKEKLNCPMCHKACGKLFWGECRVTECNISKGLNNCSECKDFPCELLKEFAYDKEQGDNGKRIENLKALKP